MPHPPRPAPCPGGVPAARAVLPAESSAVHGRTRHSAAPAPGPAAARASAGRTARWHRAGRRLRRARPSLHRRRSPASAGCRSRRRPTAAGSCWTGSRRCRRRLRESGCHRGTPRGCDWPRRRATAVRRR
ncbi:hypothetical protein G6F62_014948 [Rhizopus arrhizus]|nr:hypothetical protein G6F62_014948 [Rhizopus arrhizus]